LDRKKITGKELDYIALNQIVFTRGGGKDQKWLFNVSIINQ